MSTEVLTKGAEYEKNKALLEAKIEHLESSLKLSQSRENSTVSEISKLEMSFQSSLKERESNFENKLVDLKQKLEEADEKISSLEILNIKLREELQTKIE